MTDKHSGQVPTKSMALECVHAAAALHRLGKDHEAIRRLIWAVMALAGQAPDFRDDPEQEQSDGDSGRFDHTMVRLVIAGMPFELRGPANGIGYVISHLELLTDARIYDALGRELSSQPKLAVRDGVWVRPGVGICELRLLSEVLEEEELIGRKAAGFGSCSQPGKAKTCRCDGGAS